MAREGGRCSLAHSSLLSSLVIQTPPSQHQCCVGKSSQRHVFGSLFEPRMSGRAQHDQGQFGRSCDAHGCSPEARSSTHIDLSAGRMLMESSAVGVHPLADDGRGPELATVGVSAELEAHLVCRCFVNRFRPMDLSGLPANWACASRRIDLRPCRGFQRDQRMLLSPRWTRAHLSAAESPSF